MSSIPVMCQAVSDYTIPNRTAFKQLFKAPASPYSVWENYDIINKRRFFYFIFEQNLEYDKKEGCRTGLTTQIYSIISKFASEDTEMVEVGGVEPPSGMAALNASTCVAYVLIFTTETSLRQEFHG